MNITESNVFWGQYYKAECLFYVIGEIIAIIIAFILR